MSESLATYLNDSVSRYLMGKFGLLVGMRKLCANGLLRVFLANQQFHCRVKHAKRS
jgi:hypothetical protein